MKKTQDIKIYESQNKQSFFHILMEGIQFLLQSNYLGYQLAKRDIKAQYRQSLFGVLWSLLVPISTAAIWILLKQSGTVALAEGAIPYALYVFTGTMAWAILTEAILGPMQAVLAMRSTLSKINFPKEALILSSAYKILFNTGIKLIILLFLFIYFKQSLNTYLLFFPLALLVVLVFGISLGLFITPIGLLYGDVSKIMGPVMQILMYFSPVVFIPVVSNTLFGKIMYFNPLSVLVINFRNSLLGLPLEQIAYFSIIFVSSLTLFAVALVFFKITIPIITERIS